MPAENVLQFPVSPSVPKSTSRSALVIERVDAQSGCRITHLVHIPDHLIEIARWLGDDAAWILRYIVPLALDGPAGDG